MEDGGPADEAESGLSRRHDWSLLLVSLLLVPLAFLLPVDAVRHPDLVADEVRLGIGIFLCIGLLWMTGALPLAATALMVPVLAVVTGVMDPSKALGGFADPLIFLFFGGFALSSAMSAQGLDRWLADRIVRLADGRFLRVSYLIFTATALLSMWMSNTATTAMMVPLALGILRRIDAAAASRGNAVFLLLGTAYAASIGGLGTLVGTPPNGIAAAKLGIGFVEWLRFGVPTVLLLMPVMLLVLHVTCTPTRARFPLPEASDFHWTPRRWITLGIFALTGLAWICATWLGPRLGIAGSFDTVVALLAVLALVACRAATWRQIEAGTEWGVLLLFGGGIALSSVLDRTGSSVFMAREIVGLVDGWPVVLIIAASLLFVIVLGEFSSNTATAALMVPIFFSVAVELGISPPKLVVPLALASSCGFMLPVATPPNAIVFATGRIPRRDMLRTGALLDAACLIGVTLLAWWIF